MSLPHELQTEQLEQEYMEWFRRKFGFPPVITSRSGRPAVALAQYVFAKYAQPQESSDGDD